jgi:hypothetical protein
VALSVQSYVWPRLRHVIGLWVARTTALADTAILWAEQNQPSPALPYVGLTRRDFPLDGDDEEVIVQVTTAATLTITAAAIGETVAVVLFGTRYAYTLAGADTTEDARDALLALIAADLIRVIISPSTQNQFGVGFQPCTAVVNGTDAIDFAGLGFGPVHLTVVQGGTLSDELEYRAVAKGMRRALVRVELFWPEQFTAFESIDNYANALRDSLLEGETAEWLAQRGVGIEQAQRIRIQNISGVAGGALTERRLYFDALFNAASKRYRAENPIDSAVPPSVVVLAPTEI